MSIPVGLCISADAVLKEGFPVNHPAEHWTLMFWHKADEQDLERLRNLWLDSADQGQRKGIHALSLYGDPISEGERSDSCRQGWDNLIHWAGHFETDLVSGFTGRIRNRPVEESFDPIVSVFGELGQKARDHSVRIAFENCRMNGNWHKGSWNLAFTPRLWEILFELLDNSAFGLEWDPGHLVEMLIDPFDNLQNWYERVFHIHGKDARLNGDILSREGLYSQKSPYEFVYPGQGETPWPHIMKFLEQKGFAGGISLEDPVFSEPDRAAQEESWNYLKSCSNKLV